VDVLAPHHQGAKRHEVIDGIQVRRFRYVWPEEWQTLCYGAGIPTNLKNSLGAKLQLPFLLSALFLNTIKVAQKGDLIHAHWSLAGLAGVLAGKVLGKPVVLMMHGAEVYVLKGNPFIKFVLEQADYVLCNSSFTLSKILEISDLQKYEVISPGVDTERFHPDVDVSVFHEREPDIPKDRPLVFALGKFIERKGFSYLIEAISLLNEPPKPFLMIGGRGPLKEQLQRQAEMAGIADRVKFLDYIPDDCIPAYYAAADVFVLPSVVDARGDTEGLGVVLLESLACETPCVASAVGGILDIVTDGVNGFLVEPRNSQALGDRIVKIVKNGDLRREMGSKGREFVDEHFSWQAKAREIIRVYKRIESSRWENRVYN
jgi:glycosyltransferase involved in cell wall biosynthesis